MTARTTTRWIQWLLGAAALAALVLVVGHQSEERAFVTQLEQAEPAWLLWAFALQAATYAAQAEVWRIVLHRAGSPIRFGLAYRLGLAKLFVDQALPSLGVSGTVLVTQALEARGHPRPAVMAAVATDIASYWAAYILTLAGALAILVSEGHATSLVLAVATLFIVFGTSLGVAVLAVSGRDPGRLARRVLEVPAVGRAIDLLRQADPRLARDPALLAGATTLQAVIALLDAATVWVLIRALGAHAEPSAVFASFMIASLLRTIGFMPGGLGTFEAASVATLALVGVPGAVGLSATLLFRGLSFWLPMIPGLALSRRLTGATHAAEPDHAAARRRGRVPEELLRAASLPEGQALAALDSGHDGLTSAEAQRRLERFGPNQVTPRPEWNVVRELAAKFMTPLNFLLLLLASTSLVVGDRQAALIIASMVVLSVSLGFMQEHRSNRAAERLRAMVHTTAAVKRGPGEQAGGATGTTPERGRGWSELPIHLLVPGDVIHLSAGDMVPADTRLLTSKDLFVNQSALTGESMPVEKQADAAPVQPSDPLLLPNVCYMGTNVVSGTATAVVVLTGRRTYFGQLAALVSGEREPTDFDRGVNGVAWLMIRFIAVMAPLVFVINGLTKGQWVEALLFAVAVAVGLTPEMLPMIVTVNLGKGAIAMSRKRVIVKRLNSIQNLGAMDVLCTDKTGTLTQDRIVLERHIDVLGAPSDEVLLFAYLNSLHQSGLKNLLDVAILQHEDVTRLQDEAHDYEKLDEVPFDFARRRMSVAVQGRGRRMLICKGAVEEVVAVSRSGRAGNATFELDDTHLQQLRETSRRLNEEGFRVIALGCRDLPPGQLTCSVADESGLTLLGYVAFLDPPKESAGAAIAALRRQGVAVKILTGDNEIVSRKICRDVGLKVDEVAVGPDLQGLAPEALADVAQRATLFAKLTPSQKADLIGALRGRGHVVGFLGDGINDGPALKSADVGISVDSAVDVARETADIILLEKSLLVLGDGVREGRRVFGNILKYIRMGASSNFGNMFSVVGASAWLPFLPMAPVQVLTNNLLYDFSQAAIPTDDVDEEFLETPRRWEIGSIGRFMLAVGPISSIFDYATYCVMYFAFGAKTLAQASLFQTGWFVESLLSQTLIIHVIRTSRIPFVQSRASRPLTMTTVAICAFGAWLPYSPLAPMMGFTPLPVAYWPVLAGILACYLTLTYFVKSWLHRRFGFV
ncbi:MAG: magnesium-translocating P-type ATPase [Steroidobacteraceae bacterium]